MGREGERGVTHSRRIWIVCSENSRHTYPLPSSETLWSSCYDGPLSSAETDGALFFGLEAPEMSISGSPFPLVRQVFRNGAERSRARRFCAAKRTLDREDRCEMRREGERGVTHSRRIWIVVRRTQDTLILYRLPRLCGHPAMGARMAQVTIGPAAP